MAITGDYQSKWTGQQVDTAIQTITNNLANFQALNDNIGKIQELEGLIKNDNSGIIKNIEELQNTLWEDDYVTNARKYKFLPLTGGVMADNSQIEATRSGASYTEAPNKALIKYTSSSSGYLPLYNYVINKGSISCGMNYGAENAIEWRFLPNKPGTPSDEDYIAKITDDGCLLGACWNDYAEFRKTEEIEPGRVVCEKGDGTLIRSSYRLQAGAEVVSDTYGFAIGETKECKTPISVIGRVLAYPNEPLDYYEAGDAVCAGPNGTVSKMTREEIITYPDRIIGTVSEIPTYEEWGRHHVKVNGRIWIRIK